MPSVTDPSDEGKVYYQALLARMAQEMDGDVERVATADVDACLDLFHAELQASCSPVKEDPLLLQTASRRGAHNMLRRLLHLTPSEKTAAEAAYVRIEHMQYGNLPFFGIEGLKYFLRELGAHEPPSDAVLQRIFDESYREIVVDPPRVNIAHHRCAVSSSSLPPALKLKAVGKVVTAALLTLRGRSGDPSALATARVQSSLSSRRSVVQSEQGPTDPSWVPQRAFVSFPVMMRCLELLKRHQLDEILRQDDAQLEQQLSDALQELAANESPSVSSKKVQLFLDGVFGLQWTAPGTDDSLSASSPRGANSSGDSHREHQYSSLTAAGLAATLMPTPRDLIPAIPLAEEQHIAHRDEPTRCSDTRFSREASRSPSVAALPKLQLPGHGILMTARVHCVGVDMGGETDHTDRLYPSTAASVPESLSASITQPHGDALALMPVAHEISICLPSADDLDGVGDSHSMTSPARNSSRCSSPKSLTLLRRESVVRKAQYQQRLADLKASILKSKLDERRSQLEGSTLAHGGNSPKRYAAVISKVDSGLRDREGNALPKQHDPDVECKSKVGNMSKSVMRCASAGVRGPRVAKEIRRLAAEQLQLMAN